MIKIKRTQNPLLDNFATHLYAFSFLFIVSIDSKFK
jgi:hypothetical protein